MSKKSLKAANNTHNKYSSANIQKWGKGGLSLLVVTHFNSVIIESIINKKNCILVHGIGPVKLNYVAVLS